MRHRFRRGDPYDFYKSLATKKQDRITLAAMTNHPTPLHGRTVVLSGGTSTLGLVSARRLVEAGARVVVAGHDDDKLTRAAASVPEIATMRVDLTDESGVFRFADRVHQEFGNVDGVLHLVGGWRGGGGLAGQSESDFRFLERSLTALRHVSRAFDDDLRASSAGRTAIVSSTTVLSPLAGGANYAAIKAGCEAWMRAVAQGFAKYARDLDMPPTASCAVIRIATLAGLEAAVASAFVDMWTSSTPETFREILVSASAG